jgi:eukaryotic-like serine/threonine-protein kinase
MSRSSLRDFIEQLRQRHVFRVAAAYAIVGWIVIQVSTTVAQPLLFPEWIPRVIIVLVLLGFPIALILAWAYEHTPDGVRATGTPPPDEAATDATPALGLPLISGAAVFVLLLGAVVGWMVLRSPAHDPAFTGEAFAAQLASLADEGRYPDALDLLDAGNRRGETVPDALRARLIDKLTVLTEPSGARVRALRYAPAAEGGPPAEWLDLGSSPVHGLTLPRGDYLLRVEREGYAPVERLASTASQRSGVPPNEVPETLIRVSLLPEATVPAGMVFVPGGPYSVASRDLQGLLANLEDFFLERSEVTNSEFARFIEAGGYLDPAGWNELFTDPAIPDPEASFRTFADRTGLPGPRGWSGQIPPRGEADHPVTGITWYEAAAYCRFRDRRLPTLFEWEKAARDGEIAIFAAIQLPWGPLASTDGGRDRANFSSEGTTPVGAHPFGISPWGAYDMAGNVKEWLANATETGRAVTGGSWEDPVYLFPEVGSITPLSTSPSLGFRCARSAAGESTPSEARGDGLLRVAIETPDYEPVGDEAFLGLLSHYAYDRVPVMGVVVDRREFPGWVRERILFDGPGDERVIGYLYLPQAARPPYQTLVLVPGLNAFLGGSVPDIAEWVLAPVIRSGRAVFSVVMEGMTERSFPPEFQPPEPRTARFRDLLVHHATELRMGLDYLETRAEIDADALAYVGQSWGAGSRLIFAAVDDRFKSVVFIGGGIDERVHPTLPEASNINFAPRIRAPTLLLNGKEDEEHAWLTRGLPLWNLLTEPKELVLIEGAGHVPPPHERVPPMLDFLDRTLGPVDR